MNQVKEESSEIISSAKEITSDIKEISGKVKEAGEEVVDGSNGNNQAKYNLLTKSSTLLWYS